MLLSARWILVFLAGLLALTLLAALPASAQDSTATVELRVWQRITNPLSIYVSARHEAGSWNTLGTIPLPLDQQNSRGTFRYGDITLEVPLGSGGGGLTTNVELRVWQRITNPLSIYVSARHEAGSWNTLGTIPLALDQRNSRGTFRYGDISLEVPLPSGEPSQPLAETQNLRWLRATDWNLYRQLTTLPWVSNGVTEMEAEAVDNLLYIGVEGVDYLRSVLGFGWVQDGITETESDAIEDLLYIGAIDRENLTGNLRSALSLGWIQDGLTDVEANAIEWFYWLSHDSAQDAASVIALPWFMDSVTETEAKAIRSLSWLIDEDDASGTDIVEVVVALPWFQNGITEVESEALEWLAHLDYWSEEAAVAVIGHAFLSSVEGDDVLVLRSLHGLASRQDGRLDAVLGHPNFRDGITGDETTLVVAAATLRTTNAIRHILRPGNTRTEFTFHATALTPNLKISVVRTGTQHLQSTVDDIRDAVDFAERIMQRPLPVSHMIVVVNDSAVTEGYGGTNYGFAFSVLSDDEQHETPYEVFRFRSKIVHEVAHFFWRGHVGWIDEGVANVFEYLYGVDTEVSPGLRETARRGGCEAHDLKMLTEWDATPGQQGRYICNYFLGQMLFQELLEELGRRAFSQRLQELYRLSLDTKDDPEAETPGIAEVREAFDGHSAIVEKHWSGALNAPENRPLDDGTRGHHLVQWDQRPAYDGEFVTFRGTLLSDAVLFNETITEAQENGRNFSLHSVTDNQYVGSILPPPKPNWSWNLDNPGDVVGVQYKIDDGTFSVRFRFPQALGDPSDYIVYVSGFQDASRSSFFGWTTDVLGGARIRTE